MTKLFKSKKNLLNDDVEIVTEVKNYATLLESVDELTRTRLNSIDMSLTIQKEQFKSFGVDLTEIDCSNEVVYLKRNQNGYYADESKSLNSNEDYDNYMISLEFYEDHKDDLEIVHNLITDKEEILLGCYIVKEGTEAEIEELINDLGYGLTRKKEIYEANPEHPSKEYNHLLELMELSKNSKKLDDLLEEILNHIKTLFNDEVEIRIKKIEDKYDIDLDDSYGIILLNPINGDKHMLYAVSAFDVYKDLNSQYLIKNDKYLEIYLKLASSIIKEKYVKKHRKF